MSASTIVASTFRARGSQHWNTYKETSSWLHVSFITKLLL